MAPTQAETQTHTQTQADAHTETEAQAQSDTQTEIQAETNTETPTDGTTDIQPTDEEAAATDAALADEPLLEDVPELIAESISAEQNASRLADVAGLPRKIAVYIIASIYFVVGVLCVSITNYITEALPYIVGGLMSLIGVAGFIISLVRRDYKTIKTNKTATFLLAAGLGVMIILKEALAAGDPVMMISVIWGVFGLFEGAHAFNQAITRMANSGRCFYFIIKGIVECVVAFIMLYKPESHDAHFLHIVVFGINLILDALTMIPKVKEFLTKF